MTICRMLFFRYTFLHLLATGIIPAAKTILERGVGTLRRTANLMKAIAAHTTAEEALRLDLVTNALQRNIEDP